MTDNLSQNKEPENSAYSRESLMDKLVEIHERLNNLIEDQIYKIDEKEREYMERFDVQSELSYEQQKEVLWLYLKGDGITQISRKLGVDVMLVNKYLMC